MAQPLTAARTLLPARLQARTRFRPAQLHTHDSDSWGARSCSTLTHAARACTPTRASLSPLLGRSVLSTRASLSPLLGRSVLLNTHTRRSRVHADTRKPLATPGALGPLNTRKPLATPGALGPLNTHTRRSRVHAEYTRKPLATPGALGPLNTRKPLATPGALGPLNTHTRRSRVHTGKPLFALATRGAHARSAQHTHTRAARACTPTRASLRPLAPCMSESRCTPRVSALSRLCSLRRASAQWHPNGAIRRSCG